MVRAGLAVPLLLTYSCLHGFESPTQHPALHGDGATLSLG